MKNEEFYTIGIDGGASNTRGVLVNHLGATLSTFTLKLGTNLSVYGETAAERIVNVISKLSSLSKKAKVVAMPKISGLELKYFRHCRRKRILLHN